MIYKFILWLVSKLSRGDQKSLVIKALQELVASTDSGIDNRTAEKIITLAIKSQDNKVTSFIIKD